MTRPIPLPDAIRRAFEPTPRGVVGLVDDLLGLCQGQPLRLDFRDGFCRVRPVGAAVEDATDVPVPKPVFRAVLARVAALCNERRPDSVTPYGGGGELAAPGECAATLRAVFVNTPDEQRLEVTHATGSPGESAARAAGRQGLVESGTPA